MKKFFLNCGNSLKLLQPSCCSDATMAKVMTKVW
nr:MAG TPA: hypothetical protein [Caudoviricetes sp.]